MTKVTDLYDSFLSQVADYSFISEDRTDAEVDEELFGYLKGAIRKFRRKCRQDLLIEVDMQDEKYFVTALTDQEEDILVALMLVEYLKPIVLTSDSLRQQMSDKDYQVYSQANHIRELSLLYRVFRSESRALLSEYSYGDIEEWFK